MCTRKYLIILCVKWWLGVLLENENPTEMNWYNSSKFAKQQSCGSRWFSGFDPDPHYSAQYLKDMTNELYNVTHLHFNNMIWINFKEIDDKLYY